MLVANPQLGLVGEKARRVSFMLYKKMYEMLSHPLFGGKGDIFPAQNIKNGMFAILVGDFYFVLR